MKIVGFYPDSFKASLAKGQLESAGIEACLTNEYINDVMPWGTTQDLWVRVVVADEDYRAAMEVLEKTPEGDEAAEKGEVCPFCGSERVAFGLKGPKRWKKILWFILGALMMNPPGKVHPNYYCQDCNQEF